MFIFTRLDGQSEFRASHHCSLVNSPADKPLTAILSEESFVASLFMCFGRKPWHPCEVPELKKRILLRFALGSNSLANLKYQVGFPTTVPWEMGAVTVDMP